jgi:endonuclease G
VITGPVFDSERNTIGPGMVRVPKYLYKLVFDSSSGRAWAHWLENTDEARVGRPISYDELVKRTGIEFLPRVKVGNSDRFLSDLLGKTLVHTDGK